MKIIAWRDKILFPLNQISFIMEVYDKVKGFFLFSEGGLRDLGTEFERKNMQNLFRITFRFKFG